MTDISELKAKAKAKVKAKVKAGDPYISKPVLSRETNFDKISMDTEFYFYSSEPERILKDLNIGKRVLSLESAEQGYAESQFQLGVMYYKGDGVEKDLKQAFELWRQAAAQGHADAQNNLSVMYENGDGVEKDYERALYWYRKAAEQENPDAKEMLEEIQGMGK